MKRTPLYERHIALGAKIVDFAGWEMPVYYSGIIEEHQATRQRAGLFDICHMGEIGVSGPQALDLLQWVMTRNLGDLDVGQMKLSVLINEQGGIIDDLTIYRLDQYDYMVVTNASTKDRDFQWLQDMKTQQGLSDVEVVDISHRTGKLDLQGPRSQIILQHLVSDNLHELKYYRAVETTVVGVPAIISRSGYTGEDGFEIYADAKVMEAIWDKLMEIGADYGLNPVGLGARDTLRLEAGMMLYGHEMNETITPYEIRYGWLVDKDKAFIGRDALKSRQQEQKRKLIGFEMVGKGIARQGYPVCKDGQPIGEVTSGTYAPSLGRAIGLAFVPSPCGEVGADIDILIRQNSVRARVVKLPFYRGGAYR